MRRKEGQREREREGGRERERERPKISHGGNCHTNTNQNVHQDAISSQKISDHISSLIKQYFLCIHTAEFEV